MRTPELPPGYSVEWDPDLLILCRPDGTIVAAFNVRGATAEAVEKAAWKDHRSRQG